MQPFPEIMLKIANSSQPIGERMLPMTNRLLPFVECSLKFGAARQKIEEGS